MLKDPKKVTELVLSWELKGRMQVALNGTVIMDISNAQARGAIRGATAIVLKPSTLELLKTGTNKLTLTGSSDQNELNASITLQASKLK